MDNTSYVVLTRQHGLRKNMQLVANNIANMSTTGFRAEGVVFAESVAAVPVDGGSISMAAPRARFTDLTQGQMASTGGRFDMAIQGDGYFQIETINGVRLTRNGAFSLNEASELVTMAGDRVLDAGGAPIFVPPDASNPGIALDGTIANGGRLLGQVGVVTVADKNDLIREQGVMFAPQAEVLPAENATVHQGFLESSNVNPVLEITQMIEVQRAYELGQRLLEREDERIKSVVQTLGRAG